MFLLILQVLHLAAIIIATTRNAYFVTNSPHQPLLFTPYVLRSPL
jgi:hypothetical protein